MFDPNAAQLKLGIIGAGAMGTGIAQVAAVGGIDTRLHDADAAAGERGLQQVRKRLERQVEKGRMSAADVEAAVARLSVADAISDLADRDVVIEAVVEDLDVKQAIFAKLEETVSERCILASNTSSLPIGAIAANCARRGRIAGMHFFNPVPLMKLVEVVRALDTAPEVVEALSGLGERMGRTPVTVKDTPGFLVNFGGRAYTTEALALIHEGVATPAQVDAVMRDCCGFRMGPFELMDLTGIDVNYPVTRFVWESFFNDPRLRTTPQHRALREAGRLGRKTGAGFYEYGEDAKPESPDAVVGTRPAQRVVLVEPDDRLAELVAEAGAEELREDDGKAPLLAAPIGEDCTALAVRTGVDARRLVAVDTMFDTSRRVVVMTAPGVDGVTRDSVIDLLGKVRGVTAIGDSAGFIAQRIAAMVGNLGCEMAQIGLARPDEIDLAMRLGLNYPKGPLELCDAMEPSKVHRILQQAQAITGDDRYRPSQWLRRRALLGLPAGQC
ncbi:3-hydroxyacyl-CoA dehydrogenase [Ferruginivarius sediminum]|uniref:3-hydroxyacyl-CoA dehydrogenase n=1 Tax=Ferruginivarius sediminum TaxID=2661937 RepID=A0A369T6B2_9PROT|nr:3-hydroxyacyl-CoA dehydrogenase [Ferruginivarius sediminum]RDD60432.1 3-hydroxyacyl-CoA dehydrogenase [Ferruginivarius sediminum]